MPGTDAAARLPDALAGYRSPAHLITLWPIENHLVVIDKHQAQTVHFVAHKEAIALLQDHVAVRPADDLKNLERQRPVADPHTTQHRHGGIKLLAKPAEHACHQFHVVLGDFAVQHNLAIDHQQADLRAQFAL